MLNWQDWPISTMIFVIFSNLLSILVTDRRNWIFQRENSKIRNSQAEADVDASKTDWLNVMLKLKFSITKVNSCPSKSQFLYSLRWVTGQVAIKIINIRSGTFVSSVFVFQKQKIYWSLSVRTDTNQATNSF